MIYVSFQLTMPNVGSWDGKWTGENQGYFAVRSFPDKSESARKVKELLGSNMSRSFYYNFGDGWGANIDMKISNAVANRKLKKKSAGFCGYKWMIDSIVKNGKIQTHFDSLLAK